MSDEPAAPPRLALCPGGKSRVRPGQPARYCLGCARLQLFADGPGVLRPALAWTYERGLSCENFEAKTP